MGKFLADADLENFVTSGLYAAMYLKRHIQPHLMKVTEEECRNTCRHPPASLDLFQKTVIGNAMMNTEECNEDDVASAKVSGGVEASGGVESEALEVFTNPQYILCLYFILTRYSLCININYTYLPFELPYLTCS